jgi:hypothetical protein
MLVGGREQQTYAVNRPGRLSRAFELVSGDTKGSIALQFNGQPDASFVCVTCPQAGLPVRWEPAGDK